MSRRRAARPQINQRQVVVLNDFSGGQNDVVHASLLNDNECAVLECASLDQKGTLLPDTGRAERFAANIDANPIAGMGAYYRSDGTSRLLMAAGNSLYSDSPHLAVNYNSQAEWQAGTPTLVDAVTTPGDIAPLEPANPTFARASTAFQQNGVSVANGVPRYEQGRFAQAIMTEEGTTNLLTANQASVETDLTGFAALVGALARDTTRAWHGAACGRMSADAAPITWTARTSGTGSHLDSVAWSGTMWVAVGDAGTILTSPDAITWTARTSGTTNWLRAIAWSGALWTAVGDAGTILTSSSAGNSSLTEITGAFTVSPNTPYAFSGFLLSDGTSNMRLRVIERNASNTQVAERLTVATTTGLFTRHILVFTPTATTTNILLQIESTSTGTGWFDGLQYEVKPYATSWQLPGTNRVAETLALPSAGIYNRGNWSVEGFYTPQIPTNVGNVEKTLFAYEIDANNWLRLRVGVNGEWNFAITAGGIGRTIASASNAVVQGVAYLWQISGDGANMRLCVNGVQVGTDIAYTEPVGTMPANLFVGSRPNGTLQANGLIDDLCISNRARTLAEHQAAFSSGQPLTVDEPTTYLLPLNGALTASAGLSDWISPSIDAGTAINTGSGNAHAITTVPGLSAVTIASRSSANQATWSAWTTALVDGTLQHPANTFVQVRLRLTRDGANLPRVHSLAVSFDGRPNATLLASNFSNGGNYFYASLLDFAIVVNGIDPPRRFDGANLAVLGGSPPRGQYVAVHKNRAWMLVGSRLHFSDILNIDSWPVLNFIDISPNDGDTGTGLLTTGDHLVVTKNRSLWLLVGDTIDNFSIRRISADIGCVAPRSLTMVDNMLSFVGENGVYFSDFSQTVLASERIRQTWHRLNQRRLWQAASSFSRHKLRVALPSDESVVNDMVLIYDTIRKAWYIRRNWRASCWVEFTEARKQQTFFGHSERGQVSLIESGQSDHGAGIPFVVETKHMDMGLPQHIKRFRDLMVVVVPGTQTGVLNFRFRVNNGALSAPMPVTIQGSPDRVQRVIRVIPSQVNIVQGHNLAIRIEQSTPNAAIAVHSITLNFFIKGARVSL